jgi:TetR/AcrR family transcriptional regulator, regulator of cefoperazone and chloramphenicol sensitivity
MPMVDDTEERILTAAVQVFAEKGRAAATVREISARAGANLAAINYYFRSKENLYDAAVRRACGTCVSGIAFPQESPGEPAAEKLRRFIRMMVEHVLEMPDPAALQLMMREMHQPTTPVCAEWVQNYIRPMAGRLKAILAELLPADTPAWKVWLTGFSIVGQCLYYRQNRAVAQTLVGDEMARAVFDAERVAEHIAEFSLRGLGQSNDE